MKEKTEFYEIQRFRQWWLWLIIIFLLGFTLFNYVDNRQYISTTEIVATSAVSIFIAALFFMIKLETKIDELGIRVRLFPFHLQFKYFPWKNIDKAFIREYSPIGEYGGWGLRLGFFGRGRAYNISGNFGLQIVFKDDKKLLIGTQKSAEINNILLLIKETDNKNKY